MKIKKKSFSLIILTFLILSSFISLYQISTIKAQTSYLIPVSKDTTASTDFPNYNYGEEVLLLCGYPIPDGVNPIEYITYADLSNVGVVDSVVLRFNYTTSQSFDILNCGVYALFSDWSESSAVAYGYGTREFIFEWQHFLDVQQGTWYTGVVDLTTWVNAHSGNWTNFKGFVLQPISQQPDGAQIQIASREYTSVNGLGFIINGDYSSNNYYTLHFNLPEHGNIFIGLDNPSTGNFELGVNRLAINGSFNELSIEDGTLVYLYGVPDSGYIFNNWNIEGLYDSDSDDLSGFAIIVNGDLDISASFVSVEIGFPSTFDALVSSQRGCDVIVNINGELTTIPSTDYYESDYYVRFDDIPLNSTIWCYADAISQDWQFSQWNIVEFCNETGTNLNYTNTSTDNPNYVDGWSIYEGSEFYYYDKLIMISLNVIWIGDGTPPPDPTDTPTIAPSPTQNTPFEPIIPLSTGLALFGGIFLTMLFAILFVVLAGKDGLIAGIITGLFLSAILGLLPLWTIILVIILGAWMVLDRSGVTERITGA